MQRAAVSVMSNIAEGFERGSNKEFIQFLYMARSSSGEMRSQSYVALDVKYANETQVQEILQRCEKLSRRVSSFIDYLKRSKIKGQKFHEARVTYGMEQPETE